MLQHILMILVYIKSTVKLCFHWNRIITNDNLYIILSIKVRCVRFSPDGRMLVSCADDKTVKLHDVQSASTLHTFPELKGSTTRVAFHPSGTCIATAGSDSSVRVSLQDFSHVHIFLLLHLLFSSFFLCHFFNYW